MNGAKVSSSGVSARPAFTRREIVRYYDECETDYRLVWDLDASLAMHIGYWDASTWTLRAALARQNEVMAEFARIRPGAVVLDAGCGVGGSAIFLAERYGCHVTGITLSRNQVARARANARHRRVEQLTRFAVMDYSRTSFDANSFDVVWALESVCYAPDKLAFAREAFRILKPGGCLILADGFAAKARYTREEQGLMNSWIHTWAVASLVTSAAMRQALRGAGFGRVRLMDTTHAVVPSTRILFLHSLYAFPLSRLAAQLGLRTETQTRNAEGAYYQYRVCRRNLAQYALLGATKPRRRRTDRPRQTAD